MVAWKVEVRVWLIVPVQVTVMVKGVRVVVAVRVTMPSGPGVEVGTMDEVFVAAAEGSAVRVVSAVAVAVEVAVGKGLEMLVV